jgi:predicted negative regulator of RcsB-dependent stress response
MYEEALKEIKRATEMEKDDPVIFEHLGDVYLKLDNKDAALEAWEKSLEYHEKEDGLKERLEKKIKVNLQGSEDRDQ